jgi:hypothetical protein
VEIRAAREQRLKEERPIAAAPRGARRVVCEHVDRYRPTGRPTLDRAPVQSPTQTGSARFCRPPQTEFDGVSLQRDLLASLPLHDRDRPVSIGRTD